MLELIRPFLSWKYAPIGLFILFISSLYLKRWQTHRKTLALGSHAPDVGTPGILGLGFFWGAIQTWRNNTVLEYWDEIFERIGCVKRLSYTAEVAVMDGYRMILTADPENVKAMLATQFKDFGKGPNLLHDFMPFLGKGVLTTDGQPWHDARSLMRPLFMRERVSDLDLFERNVQRLIPLLGDGENLEFDDLVFRYTLDTVSEFLLGTSVGSLGDPANGFTKAFSKVQEVQSVIMRAGPLAWAIPRKEYMKNIKVCDTFLEPFISQAVALPAGSSELKKSETLLHALAAYTRDRQIIRDQLMNVLFAGSDTTASALSWVFFELSRHPEVVKKLRTMILNTLGTDGRAPTYQEVKDMKYITYVINESMRLYATMPFATRQALVNTTLPRGGGPDGLDPVGIPAGTPVLYSALMMHRRRDLYPPISEKHPYDPKEWAPERWENWKPTSWQTIPFSGGARICIGQQFALMEMAYTLCRVLQEFDQIVDYSDGGPPELSYGIVVTSHKGVRIGFKRAS